MLVFHPDMFASDFEARAFAIGCAKRVVAIHEKHYPNGTLRSSLEKAMVLAKTKQPTDPIEIKRVLDDSMDSMHNGTHAATSACLAAAYAMMEYQPDKQITYYVTMACKNACEAVQRAGGSGEEEQAKQAGAINQLIKSRGGRFFLAPKDDGGAYLN